MADDGGVANVREIQRLVRAGEEEGVRLRFLGGAAIALHCGRGEEPHRSFSDIDGVVGRKHVKKLRRTLEGQGYEGDRQFNTLNATERLIYYGPTGKLDIFVEEFRMCHKIPVVDRLGLDSPTLTVTDLLLTKLQVVELNEKDLEDLRLLIAHHDVQPGEGDHINSEYLGALLGRDWGLWRTCTQTLETIRKTYPELSEKITEMERAIEAAPRSLSFRRRAILGERSRWYDEPEEV